MKISRRVVMTKKVCDTIRKARMTYIDTHVYTDARGYEQVEEVYQAVLFLLGADKNRVIKGVARITPDLEYYQSDGCEYLPGVTASNMRRAYTTLINQKLTPIGFGHKLHETMLPSLNKYPWDGMLGHDLIKKFPGFIVVRFHPDPRAIKIYERNKTKWIPLTIQNR